MVAALTDKSRPRLHDDPRAPAPTSFVAGARAARLTDDPGARSGGSGSGGSDDGSGRSGCSDSGSAWFG